MHWPLLQHGCTTGRPLWVGIMVALGLALGSQAVAAKECQRETPGGCEWPGEPEGY